MPLEIDFLTKLCVYCVNGMELRFFQFLRQIETKTTPLVFRTGAIGDITPVDFGKGLQSTHRSGLNNRSSTLGLKIITTGM